MTALASERHVRCAVYCRKSTDEGLDKDFNSLDAQRECGEAHYSSPRCRAKPPGRLHLLQFGSIHRFSLT
jgi:hypothetical protein